MPFGRRSSRTSPGATGSVGFATVCLVLLVIGMTACRKEEEAPADANVNQANRVAMRPVRLYFESPRMLLGAETRTVALPESPAAAIPVLVRELMKGPAASSPLGRLFPPDTAVRGAFLLPGGTVVVDLGGSTLTQGWGTGSHQELMAVQSLVQSLAANFPEAKRVRLVVNGSSAETLGGHLSLRRSFAPPSPNLLEPTAR